MTPQEAQALLDSWRDKMQAVPGDQLDEMIEVYQALKEWQKNGAFGEIPYAETLRNEGVLSFTGNSSALPELGSVSAASRLEDSLAADANDALSPDQIKDDSAAASDDDRRAVEEAQAKLRDGDIFAAHAALKALQGKVHGDLIDLVEAGYQSASVQLEEGTAERVRRAHDAASRYPNDLVRQEASWNEVIRFNKESSEANKALVALGQRRVDRQIEGDLDKALTQARHAFDNKNLPQLNQGLGKLQTWRSQGESDPPGISDDVYQSVLNAERELTELRQRLRGDLGQTSTLLATGDYRLAYEVGRRNLEQGVPVLVDRTGQFGPVGEEVSTVEFFRRAKELFLPSLVSLAAQRVDTAAGQEKGDPEGARDTLRDAIARLSDDVLTSDDKAELRRHREPIDQKLAEIERLIKHFESARQKVNEANAPNRTREAALMLFQEAEQLYPDYPNIKAYIEEARDQVAEVVATDVNSAIATARRLMERDEFEHAATTLQEARTQAIQQIPSPKPESGLRVALQGIAELEGEIARAAGAWQRMMTTLQEVDSAIKRFDGGDSRALSTARSLMAQLTSQTGHHPEVSKRIAELSNRQNDVENWESGQAAYRQRDWENAELQLRRVAGGSSAFQEEAARLGDRALAAQLATEAEQAEKKSDWGNARTKYQQAFNLLEQVGTDALTQALLEQCRSAITRLAPLEKNDREVGTLITQARSLFDGAVKERSAYSFLREKVRPSPQFAEAVSLLKQAEEKQSTRTAEVSELLHQVRHRWRSAYLEAMSDTLRMGTSDQEILEAAVTLGESLQEANLLYESDDDKLLTDLRVQVLDLEYRQLHDESRPVQWQLLEANRKKRREVRRDSTVDDEYREAVRETIKDEFHRRKSQNKPDALKYLDEQLQRPELHGDEDLVGSAIELCWEQAEWSIAEKVVESHYYRDHDKKDVFSGLTRAASQFHDGFVAQGQEEVKTLRHRHNGNSNLIELIDKRSQSFLNGTIDGLVRKAQDSQRARSDDGYIEAAELYAQAAELSPNDRRISAGLSALSSQLSDGIQSRCRQAKAIAIGNRTLESAKKEADSLYKTLSALDRVADRLKLDEELHAELSDSVEQLDERRKLWKGVLDALERAALAREDALAHPKPLFPDNPSQGGWDFSSARASLQSGRQLAGRDQATLSLIQTELNELERLERTGRDLTEQLTDFIRAVRDEEFDTVIQMAGPVAGAWRMAHEQADWRGIDGLLRHHYPASGPEHEPERHKQLAQQRKENLDQWDRWAKETKTLYSQLRTAAQELTKPSFDDLRLERPMADIEKESRKAKELCLGFEEQLSSTPSRPPLSRKAETTRATVESDTWLDEINSYIRRLSILETQAHTEVEKLTEPLRRLTQIFNTQLRPKNESRKPWGKKAPRIADASFRLADEVLRECMAIDPMNSKVQDFQKRLRQLRNSVAG